jgi:hypothetical protein
LKLGIFLIVMVGAAFFAMGAASFNQTRRIA